MATLDRYTKKTLGREVIMVILAALSLVPFYILVMVALKSTSEAATTSPVAPPLSPTVENFVTALSETGTRAILPSMLNSVIITAGTLVLLVVFGSIAAYTLSRRLSRLGSATYYVFLVGIILPFQLGLIPTYVALRSVHLVGTQVGMILIYTGMLMPLAVFLYAGFARALGRDYEEAAYLDGASRLQIFTRVVFPLLGPATGTVVIMTGLLVWNDFFTALIFLSGSPNSTLPVAIYGYVGENASEWNLIFAAVIISMVPILAFYLAAQRKFIQGFAGGVKA